MAARPRLANELWYEIFAFLPPAAIRNLSSTDRDFHSIVRPFGFSKYHVVPHSHTHKPPTAHLERSLQRLDFYSSEKIAPHVHSCVVKVPHWLRVGQQPAEAGAPHVLMREFYDRLSLFSFLQRLELSGIQITQLGFSGICALPALKHLSLSSVGKQGTIMAGTLTLRVKSLVTIHDFCLGGPLSHVLSPDTLEQLDFSDFNALAAPGVGPFPHVHTLKVMDDIFISGAEAQIILAKFTAVRSFCVRFNGLLQEFTPETAAGIFPVLREYAGERENLYLFIKRPTLSYIMLNPFILSRSFEAFMSEFKHAKDMSNVKSIKATFTVEDFGVVEFARIFTLFPCLTQLYLYLNPDDVGYDGSFCPEPLTLIDTLANQVSLPKTLQTLSLCWQFNYFNGREVPDPAKNPASDTKDFCAVRDSILACCQNLCYLYLDGYHFSYLWWKGEQVWEETTRSHEDTERLGDEIFKRRRMLNPDTILARYFTDSKEPK
ncbi:hypothetical protein R3P38DRAFT_2666855 [Favolaschia claudopus]|uniref:F-box domain-containing protein n=1 Tax=Favolaschia claudopus TaxID=2862362 RepID=A0AAV9ZAK3_9AGAR